ncbi:MAG: hypothetical protein WC845_03540 [Candidatus Staskawiczbacteria bacterium]
MKKVVVFFISLILLSYASEARASRFIMFPPQLVVNQTAEVILSIDTEDQNINAIDLKLNYSKEDFLVKRINEAGSVISFWIEQPVLSKDSGEISLSGIMAGGFQGKTGVLLKIYLVPLNTGEKSFAINQAKILLNDGQGTEATLNPSALNFQVIAAGPPEEVIPEEPADTELPESFIPEISQHPDIFDGQWFLSFNTQDKNSGIDYYQVREVKQDLLSFLTGWENAESPYLLKDQQLRSFVYLKAVDRAGNARIVILPAPNPLLWYENYLVYLIIILIIVSSVVAVALSRFLWRKK